MVTQYCICLKLQLSDVFNFDITEQQKAVETSHNEAEVTQPTNTTNSTAGEQTTLVHNEEEAFALEPLDVTAVPGTYYYQPFKLGFNSFNCLHLFKVSVKLIFGLSRLADTNSCKKYENTPGEVTVILMVGTFE